MAITFSVGGNVVELTHVRGQAIAGTTVGALLQDPGFRSIFNLTGRETLERETSNGGFVRIDTTHVMQDGDYIALTAPAGTKGSVVRV